MTKSSLTRYWRPRVSHVRILREMLSLANGARPEPMSKSSTLGLGLVPVLVYCSSGLMFRSWRCRSTGWPAKD